MKEPTKPTGKERVAELARQLESWCWAHSKYRPTELEDAIAKDLDALTVVRAERDRAVEALRLSERKLTELLEAEKEWNPADEPVELEHGEKIDG